MSRSRKPLEWRREDSVTIRAGRYSVNKIKGRYDAWWWEDGRGPKWTSVMHRTQREAKAECERHAASNPAIPPYGTGMRTCMP